MSSLPKSIHWCRRYSTKFNSGWDIPFAPGSEDEEPTITVDAIRANVKALDATTPLFSRMAHIELQRNLRMVEDMRNGVMDITGDHEEIVAGFSEFLSILQEGDEYFTISIPQFWTARNMGINGRFVSINKLCIQRSVTIRRLFQLTKEDCLNDTYRQILATHAKMRSQLRKNDFIMDVRCSKMDEISRNSLIRHGGHLGVMIVGSVAMTCIPVYDDDWIIRTVRIRKAEATSDLLRSQFDGQWQDAEELDETKPVWLWNPDS